MRRTVMQFASLRGCKEREISPGCGFDEYFGMKRDDRQRWPPGPCEGPAANGRTNRGESVRAVCQGQAGVVPLSVPGAYR